MRLNFDILSWLPWQLQELPKIIGDTKSRNYLPLWLSKPDDGKQTFAFRYVISLGTTFIINVTRHFLV